MSRFLHLLALAVAGLAASAMPPAWAAPQTIKASYSAFMNGLSIGTVAEQFSSEGAQYQIVSETRPSGLAALIQRQPLRFASTGIVDRDGLRPVHFEARRTPGEGPQVTADFDWGQSQLVLKHDGKTDTLPLPSGTQDRLSVMYQFLYLPLERTRQLDFAMTNGRKLDHYRYRVSQEVEIDTGLGRLKALHLIKVREPGDTVTEIWLSSQHHFFPVRILIVERDGMRFEQVIRSLELRD